MRKKTGVIISKQQYAENMYCVRCARIGDTRLCDACRDWMHCEGCGLILRNEYQFYTYRQYKVGNEWNYSEYVQIKKPFSPPAENGKTCLECVDWKSKIKHICKSCQDTFLNTPDLYRRNGNLCLQCSESARHNFREMVTDRNYARKQQKLRKLENLTSNKINIHAI